jgi:cyclopropane fatty-acyl-phospholipid synthase-like methyltransferase
MTVADTHEERVRRFYSEGPTGEGAGLAYSVLMDDTWHHGDRAVERAGGQLRDAQIAMQQRLASHAGIRSGHLVLDFGAGPGGATLAMAVSSGARFIGVSNTETLNERARALAEERGMTARTSFLTLGNEDYKTLLPWPDASFDAMVFLESVCHLPDKQAFFRAAFRVLRPGGRLAGLDWIQRPYGGYQTAEQIQQFITPVCEHIRLAGLGTVESYSQMMRAAGFDVLHAEDEFAGELCWGSTPAADREKWLTYGGPSGELFQNGKRALDAARHAGVFTVGWWAAAKSR